MDSALERDLGLDNLSGVELAARPERAFAAILPEQALGGAVTLRDLLKALQDAPRVSSATTHAALSVGWSEPDQAIPVDAATLVETLEWHAHVHPDRVHIVYLGDSGSGSSSRCADRATHRLTGCYALTPVLSGPSRRSRRRAFPIDVFGKALPSSTCRGGVVSAE